MIDLPEPVRRKAEAAGAADWLDSLPELVRTLERDWAITVGDGYPDGTEALVARARTADGTDAVLKLLIPRGDGWLTRNEITVLRLADGDGCIRLLRADGERDALLLERAGPSMSELGVPIGERHEILAGLARRVWRPAVGVELPSGSDKAAWLAEYIPALWSDLGRPCAEQAVRYAVECAERRRDAHDESRAVLVHGDVHQWNALQTTGGFTLIDPDGLIAEPECDLGVLMREDPVELLDGDPRTRADRLARLTGCDPAAIWEWGAAERVSTGLLFASIDFEPTARQMLRAAEVAAEVGAGR